MAEDYKSYRIRTNVGGNDNVLNVKLTQTYDTLEVLSLKIDQKNSYKIFKSDYGVVVGRVFANGGYGVPNAKVSVFIPKSGNDFFDEELLYPYISTTSLGNDNVRYNLLPDFVDVGCHQDVGTFPNKRYVLDNDDIIEVFDKYYTYTTTTNNAGDYMLFGVPTGDVKLHMDVDLSDIGTLSQRPRDFLYKGYSIEQFDSPTKFKKSTNLSSLVQIMSEDKDVYVYSYWGDTSETDSDIAITRCDFELAYKFEPTCVFMGSIITDTGSNAISKRCVPDVKSGQMSELVAGAGTIEMIRKTFDNKVEQYSVNGNQNIDENGVWCYQIPMNLDYVITDEFGSIVPSNNPEKGIPTRTRVRFRVTLNDMPNDDKARNRCRYLIPNNPRFDDRYPSFSHTPVVDYEFGSMTKDENFCDLFWNNVYTVKNYIPRMQKNTRTKHGRNYSGIKLISHYGDNNPMPYNQVTTRMAFTYIFLCNLFKFIVDLLTILNGIISYAIGGIIGILATPFCRLAKVHIWKWHPFGFLNPVCKALKKIIPSCIGMDGSFCGENVTHAYTFYPGCGDFNSDLGIGSWTNTLQKHTKDQNKKIRAGEMTADERTQPTRKDEELRNCIETSLAEEYDVISFNFNNDWINGSLYMPMWFRKITKKKSYFFGIFTKPAQDLWCSSEINDQYMNLKVVQPCAFHRKRATDGNHNGCGGKNEGCLTAKGVIGFKHGFIVPKETMLGQTVYYYSACEVTGEESIGRRPANESNISIKESTGRYIKLLFATDIVLLGSLNDTDLNGVPQFFKSLESTTYKMPPTVLQTANVVSVTETEEDGIEDITYAQASATEFTGRDWGNVNDDICNSDRKTSKDGGLFYGIGCSSTQMTPKTCINVSRICEFGVSLDEDVPVPTKKLEGNRGSEISISESFEYITPDGYISFDEINNETQRSAFATLNGNFLRTKLSENNGLKEYIFKYIHVDNFDGLLQSLMKEEQQKCTKLQKYNYMLEMESEGYLNFRLGYNPFYYVKDKFPRYENSFYFYFGLKEGKTALDKLYKYYVSDCEDTTFNEAPVNIIVKGNDWCSFGSEIIDIEQGVWVNDYNGYVAFEINSLDLPCTILMQKEDDEEGIDEREFIVYDEKTYIASKKYTEGCCSFPSEEVVKKPEIICSNCSNGNNFNDEANIEFTCETEDAVIFWRYVNDETGEYLDKDKHLIIDENTSRCESGTIITINDSAKIVAQAFLNADDDEAWEFYSKVTGPVSFIKVEENTGSSDDDDQDSASEEDEEQDNGFLPELGEFKKVCVDINQRKLLMVSNGVYDITITDDNGNNYSTRITIGSPSMECVITPSNFETPYNRLIEQYPAYSIVSNKSGLYTTEDNIEVPLPYTTNLTRDIGGTINISLPRESGSNVLLPNFIITINCDAADVEYSVKLTVEEFKYKTKKSKLNNALLYPELSVLAEDEDISDIGGFIFGVPNGDVTYNVNIIQTCKICDNDEDNDGEIECDYLESQNIISREVFITDKTQYKLFINDVDYDVIRHWQCGFDVDNINIYANTARIYETGVISNEWFDLSNEDNYRWYEYKDYKAIDKELVQLTRDKYDILAVLSEDSLLYSKYEELFTGLSGLENENRNYLLALEKGISFGTIKNYLYTASWNNVIIYNDLPKLKDALNFELGKLTNKCVKEIKLIKSYNAFENLVEYGKNSYERVFENYLNNESDYITESEFNELGQYISKNISYYPYEYESNIGNVIKRYGYIDMVEGNDANLSTWQRDCVATEYIRVSFNNEQSVTERAWEDMPKYIPYEYQIGDTTGRCGRYMTTVEETYESENVREIDVFTEPGRFNAVSWVNVSEYVTIDEDNTIGASADCSSNDHIIYSMFNRRTKEYLPYLGYNTLQYTNKKKKYTVKSYVKILDKVEYNKLTDATKQKYEVYQYIKIDKVLTLNELKNNADTEGYKPYCVERYYSDSGNYQWEYYTEMLKEIVDTTELNNTKIYYLRQSVFDGYDDNGIVEPVVISVNQFSKKPSSNTDTYIEQYIVKDDRHIVTYSEETYKLLEPYGQNAYDVDKKLYINKDSSLSTQPISESEYNNLPQSGSYEYTPKTYLPIGYTMVSNTFADDEIVNLVWTDIDDTLQVYEGVLNPYRGENRNRSVIYKKDETTKIFTSINWDNVDLLTPFNYIWNGESDIFESGRIITSNEYEHLGFYEAFCQPYWYKYDKYIIRSEYEAITEDGQVIKYKVKDEDIYISVQEYNSLPHSNDYEVIEVYNVFDVTNVRIRYQHKVTEEIIDEDVYNTLPTEDKPNYQELIGYLAEEYEGLSTYSQSFYTIADYEYVVSADVFKTLELNQKRHFIKETRGSEDVYVFIISKEIYENESFIDTDDGNKIKIHTIIGDIEQRLFAPRYVNILNENDVKLQAEYEETSMHMSDEFAIYSYEENVGSDLSIIECNEDDNDIFSNIVACNEQILEYLISVDTLKSDFILAAKSAFWMVCPDSTNVLSFRVETDDRPAEYHLIYKEELIKENDLEESQYVGLSNEDYYVSDGTSDIIVTIPTICLASDEQWGNNCHLIPSNPDLCFARDNTEGTCTKGSKDEYYRKAFFIAVANAKGELIPYGTYKTDRLSDKHYPIKYFGVHVVDKRFVNSINVWSCVSGIPKFYNEAAQESVVEINMFGCITGYLTNGIVDMNLNEYKEANNTILGYDTFFEVQRVGDVYDINLFTPMENNVVNEDRPGIRRYVNRERITDELKEEIRRGVLAYNPEVNDDFNAKYIQEEDGIVTIKDEIINDFKPFKNYRIVNDTTDCTTQYSILPSLRTTLNIEDKFSCGISSTIDGELKFILNKKSVNDSTTVVWGGFKPYTMWDSSYLNVSLSNRDIDEFTIYAFEVKDDSYPLNSAENYKLGDVDLDTYYIEIGNSEEEFINEKEFENTESDSKYIFGINVDVDFNTFEETKTSVASLLGWQTNSDEYTNLSERDCKVLDYVEGNTQNEVVFKHCHLYNRARFATEENVDTYIGKIGKSETTPLLYSASEELSFIDVMDARNRAGVVKRERFTSGMARKHKSYAVRIEHVTYKPTSDGFVDEAGNPIAETMDIGEYNEYLGFSHNGEFALRPKFVLLTNKVMACSKDECDESKNADGDKLYTGYFTIEYGGVLETFNSHRPYYLVAISDDGISKVISPVYDFRIMNANLTKILFKGIKDTEAKYYYKFNITAYESDGNTKTSVKPFYFWNYEYEIVDYEIMFNLVNGSGETEEATTFGRSKSDGIAKKHQPDKIGTKNVVFDDLIDYPKVIGRDDYAHWKNKTSDFSKITVEGKLTLVDKMGLKHIIPIRKETLNTDVETQDQSNFETVYVYEIDTNGGVWSPKEMSITNIQDQVPYEYGGTSMRLEFSHSGTLNNSNLTDITTKLNNYESQLMKNVNGVTYKFKQGGITDKWSIEDKTIKPQWTYKFNANEMCVIEWKWHEKSSTSTIQNDVYTYVEEPAVINSVVRKPSAVTPSMRPDSFNMIFKHLWRIEKQDGTYDTITDNGSFVANIETYKYTTRSINLPNDDNNNTVNAKVITVDAVYAPPVYVSLYFIDQLLDTSFIIDNIEPPRVYNGQYGEGIEVIGREGQTIEEVVAENECLSTFVPYDSGYGSGLIKWVDSEKNDIVSDYEMVIYGEWSFTMNFKFKNNIDETNITDEDKKLKISDLIVEYKFNGINRQYNFNLGSLINYLLSGDSKEGEITETFSNGKYKEAYPLGGVVCIYARILNKKWGEAGGRSSDTTIGYYFWSMDENNEDEAMIFDGNTYKNLRVINADSDSTDIAKGVEFDVIPSNDYRINIEATRDNNNGNNAGA